MTDREQEAIERMVEAMADTVVDWDEASRALDALTLPRSAPCPTCGGTGDVCAACGVHADAPECHGTDDDDCPELDVSCPNCKNGSVSLPPLLRWNTPELDEIRDRVMVLAENGDPVDPDDLRALLRWNEE